MYCSLELEAWGGKSADDWGHPRGRTRGLLSCSVIGEKHISVLGWRRNEKRQQLMSKEHIWYVYARVGKGMEGHQSGKGNMRERVMAAVAGNSRSKIRDLDRHGGCSTQLCSFGGRTHNDRWTAVRVDTTPELNLRTGVWI